MIDYFFTPQCMNVAGTVFFLFDANIQFKNNFQFAPPNLCSVKILIGRTTLKITAIGPDLDQPYLTTNDANWCDLAKSIFEDRFCASNKGGIGTLQKQGGCFNRVVTQVVVSWRTVFMKGLLW